MASYAQTAEIIPVPVDNTFFRPATELDREQARRKLGLEPSDIMLLFTGHLDPGKGLHNLIEALGSLGSSAVKLYVVGEPEMSRRAMLETCG